MLEATYLDMINDLLLMPPWTTLRFWVRVVLKEFSDGEWRENFHISQRSFIVVFEDRENHASTGCDCVCTSTTDDTSGAVVSIPL